ncbi:interaptin-like [Archocentrus centrarchus]|uniref:interaptin-like n=1 Tax=Archocentrus centrarchus TaxID=63155 RepID=UPI0011E9EFCF|nr:interaptin-like [Archocentrus centrarchus]
MSQNLHDAKTPSCSYDYNMQQAMSQQKENREIGVLTEESGDIINQLIIDTQKEVQQWKRKSNFHKEMYSAVKDEVEEIPNYSRYREDKLMEKIKTANEKTEGLLVYLADSMANTVDMFLDKDKLEGKCVVLQGELCELEAAHRDVQCKLHDSEEKNKALEARLEEALQKNGEMQDMKEELKEMQTNMQNIVQDFEREKKKFKVLYHKCNQMKEDKNDLEKKCADMQCTIQEMVKVTNEAQKVQKEKYKKLKEKHEEKHQELKELEKRCKKLEEQNAENISKLKKLTLENEEPQERCQKKKRWFRFCWNKSTAEMQCKSQEMVKDMHEAQKVQNEKYKKLKEKHEEKHQELKELEKKCKKLEEQNAENISKLKKLTLENEELQERCQKKKKWFRFCWNKSTDSSQKHRQNRVSPL